MAQTLTVAVFVPVEKGRSHRQREADSAKRPNGPGTGRFYCHYGHQADREQSDVQTIMVSTWDFNTTRTAVTYLTRDTDATAAMVIADCATTSADIRNSGLA
jgi:hypothetical protein